MAGLAAAYSPTQLIDGDGALQAEELQHFVEESGLRNRQFDYGVVAIMGPQSSGKSTLMNHMFHTQFATMDALEGRQQTTRGVWMSTTTASSGQGDDPLMLVMDLEGTDGRERGEDDTNFERQTALFGLAVADVLIINMWCHDVGREVAANKPLLKNIFQVNLKLFSPRKSSLVFVLRDQTRTPIARLREQLLDDLNRIWGSISLPEDHDGKSFGDFFDVEVMGMPSFEEKENEFLAECTQLRTSLASKLKEGTRRQPVPGSDFVFSVSKIWEAVVGNKDLSLPKHMIMVATYRCSEVSLECLTALEDSKECTLAHEHASNGAVAEFKHAADSAVDSALRQYDEATVMYDSEVTSKERSNLLQKALGVFRQDYETIAKTALKAEEENLLKAFAELRSAAEKNDSWSELATSLKEEVDKLEEQSIKNLGAILDSGSLLHSDWRETSGKDLQSRLSEAFHRCVIEIKRAVVSGIVSDTSRRVANSVSDVLAQVVRGKVPVSLFWPTLQQVIQKNLRVAGNSLKKQESGLSALGSRDNQETSSLGEQLQLESYRLVSLQLKTISTKVVSQLKERFAWSFQKDKDGLPRRWKGSVNISAIALNAKKESAKLLGELAVLKLSESGELIDKSVTDTVLKMALEEAVSEPDALESAVVSDEVSSALSASEFLSIPKKILMLDADQCKEAWFEFESEYVHQVRQAMELQEAARVSGSKLPPLWTLAAMVVLGWNETMGVIRNLFNPSFLLIFAVLTYLIVILRQRKSFKDLFSNGVISGLIALGLEAPEVLKDAAQRIIHVYDSLQNSTVAMHKKTDSDGELQSAESDSESSVISAAQPTDNLRKRPAGSAQNKNH